MNTTPDASKQLLWHAVERLMLARYGKVNFTRLASESGIGLGTAARLKDEESTIGLDKVAAIARTFGLQLHELLDPNFDPKKKTTPLSPEAMDLALNFDRIRDIPARHRAYAIASQMLEFACTPSQQVPPVP